MADRNGELEAKQQRGPNEEKIKELLKRSGYVLNVTHRQRLYGISFTNWNGPVPGNGSEIFCGNIPYELFEYDLLPIFEQFGKIFNIRLMMNPFNGQNRGFAFIKFPTSEAAINAVRQLDNYQIANGKFLKVKLNIPNVRLFVGNIPKSKTKEEILDKFRTMVNGVIDIIIYKSPDDTNKNRGFCFIDFASHGAAYAAKQKLGTVGTKVWGCHICVDWADPLNQPDKETMSKVKALYVTNISKDVSEDNLKELFCEYGAIERVKKIKYYAFIHFEDRDSALKAMNGLNGKVIGANKIQISLAKEPLDKKKRHAMLMAREHRMLQTNYERNRSQIPTLMTRQYVNNTTTGHHFV